MKNTTMWSAVALGTAALATSWVLGPDSASAKEELSRPFLDIQVDPDIGNYSDPTVRIERIRRSAPSTVGTGGGEGASDAGMINFEILVTNHSAETIEIDRVVTRFNGLNNPIPSGWFEGLDISDLMHNANGSWAANGNVINKGAADLVVTVAGATTSGSGNDYVVGGVAVFGGDMKFHVARHNDWNGELQAESFPFEGHAFDITGHEGYTPEPVYAAGQKGFEDEEQVGVVVKYDTSDYGLALDTSFGGNGIVEVDIPFHVDEMLTQVAPIRVGGQTYIMAAGTFDQNTVRRPFLVRLHADGSTDESFGGLGLKLFPESAVSRTPVALDFRIEPGETEPSIYLLEAVGSTGSCADEGIGCKTQLTRLNWDDGSLDGNFGVGGTASLAFPDSLSDIPYGLALLPTGEVIIGATRMQKVTKAPWIGLAGLTADGKLNPAFALWGYRVASMNLESVGGRGLVLNGAELAVGAVVLTPGKRQVALFRFDLGGNVAQIESNRQDPNEEPRIFDFDVDSNGRYVAFGTEVAYTQITRFRSDGRLDWRGVIDPDETQRVRWPDDREVAEFPTSIEFDLWIEEWLLPYTKQASVKEDAIPMHFPLQAPDELEYWRVNQQHRLRDDHRGSLGQRYAYDLGAHRWSKVNKLWTSKIKVYDDQTPKNEKFLAYGRQVHAGRSGIVVSCWNAAPENQDPPNMDAFDDDTMPGGGNFVKIQHADGSIALYAHFIPGSIPPEVCPNNCTNYSTDAAEPWLPEYANDEDPTCNSTLDPDQPILVKALDVIGSLGNSGRSTGPHLHFHVEDEKGGRPMYFWDVKTERIPDPDPPEGGAVSMSGSAAAAPPLFGAFNGLIAE